MRKIIIFVIISIFTISPLYAQSEAALRKTINSLEASIEKEEKELAKLKKDKNAKQKLVNSLARQIEKRNALIAARDKQIKQLNSDISKAQKRIGELSLGLDSLEQSCSRMVCEAYRNYRNTNTLSYIFSSSSFLEMAKRIVALRSATVYRKGQIDKIIATREDIKQEQQSLSRKREEVAVAKKKLDSQRAKMREERDLAKATIRQMTKKEKSGFLACSSRFMV